MSKALDNYTHHQFPIECFTTGKSGFNQRIGVSAGFDRGIAVYNFDQNSADQNKDFSICVGHQSIIQRIELQGSYMVTGSSDGEIKVTILDKFQKELKKQSTFITLKA